MNKYYKAKLMLYSRDKVKNDFIIDYCSCFTHEADIIVKKTKLGYKEICTNKKFNYYDFYPIYIAALSQKKLFHITELDSNITNEDITSYIEEFDYDKFDEIVQKAQDGKKLSIRDRLSINSKIKMKKKENP